MARTLTESVDNGKLPDTAILLHTVGGVRTITATFRFTRSDGSLAEDVYSVPFSGAFIPADRTALANILSTFLQDARAARNLQP
jgi:hypothetical protein